MADRGGKREGAGRPRFPEGEKLERVTLFLPAAVAAWLQRQAQASGVNRSTFARLLLQRVYKRSRSPSP